MNQQILFVYNPRAGKAQIRSNLLDIIDIFVKEGYEVTASPTQGQGDAINIVANRRDDYSLVVCSGGDGTLNEAVSGMLKSDKIIPIGYVPAGSTNDFAKSLKIPKKMTEAARVAITGKNFACDIGAFADKNFVYVAAFGVLADVTHQTNQDLKNALGYAAYIIEGAMMLPSIKSYHLKITLPETTEIIEDDFMLGMITNSLSVGGFSNLTDPNTELDDGIFEVLLIKKAKNPIELNETLAALLIKDFDSPHVLHLKTSKLTIESDEDVSWTLDGEFGGIYRTVEISNLRRAIQIRVPQ